MKSELSPVEKRLVWDEAKEAELQKLRHMKAAAEACKGISTEALEAGVVEDVVYYLHAAMEWIDAVPDDVVATLPAMPGFDRDKLSDALALLETKP